MQSSFFLLFLALASKALGQFNDINVECDEGAKLAKISREAGSGDKLGAMSFECEPIEPKPSGISCTPSEKPLNCDGEQEGCEAGSWIGGIKGYELDPKTGAVMLHPICCSSSDVKVQGCQNRRFNSIRSEFDLALSRNQVFSGFKCWRMHTQSGEVFDFMWRGDVCTISVAGADKPAPARPTPTRPTPRRPTPARPTPRRPTPARPTPGKPAPKPGPVVRPKVAPRPSPLRSGS